MSDILDFFPTNSLSWDQLEYGTDNVYNLHYGLIHKGLPIQIEVDKCSLPNIKEDFIPKNYTLCEDGDIAFADASEDTNDVGKVVEFLNCENNTIVCGLHTIHGRDKKKLTIKGFKGYAFSSEVFRQQVRRLAQGTKIYSISQKNFSDIFIGIPSKEEQIKIATLLRLLDERITTQNKIIEQYKSLIKGMSEMLFSWSIRFKDKNGENYPKWGTKKLGESSTIATGKLDANAMDENGEYRFYTCAKEHYYINQFAFDTEALLISGNGANVGYIHYYKGKFNAYQRTYILDNFKENIIYVKFFLDHFLYARIYSEKKEGNTPYIVLSTLSEMDIIFPCIEEQIKIADSLSKISDKIEVEKQFLEQLENQKKYLLQQIFI